MGREICNLIKIFWFVHSFDKSDLIQFLTAIFLQVIISKASWSKSYILIKGDIIDRLIYPFFIGFYTNYKLRVKEQLLELLWFKKTM